MQPTVAILTVGSEILDGRVQDTNANYLAGLLADYGIDTALIASCPDDLAEIQSALGYALSRASTVLVSGGLGPTADDMTRDAVAALTGQPLVQNSAVLRGLEELYRNRQRPFDPINARQTYFPSGATVLHNPIGTAAGFSVRTNEGRLIAAMPGVPGELRRMMEEELLQTLCQAFGVSGRRAVEALRVFGLPESIVGARIEACAFKPELVISYRAHFPEIHVVLKGLQDPGQLAGCAARAREAVGDEFVFSDNLAAGIEDIVFRLMTHSKLTLAVAESCTGGQVGMLLTSVPGSSSYFLGGAIAYSNQLKCDLLGVRPETLDRHGAVSRETAAQMAEGARERFQSNLGLSVTGIAGPDGGSELKPVGTFFIGLAAPERTYTLHYFLNSSRKRVRTYAAWSALDTVRRHLLGLSFREEFKPLSAAGNAS